MTGRSQHVRCMGALVGIIISLLALLSAQVGMETLELFAQCGYFPFASGYLGHGLQSLSLVSNLSGDIFAHFLHIISRDFEHGMTWGFGQRATS